ncbi:glycosyltransferase family 4 protein [Modestobacter sp. VKM Ac-2986]|uniref:glycosyltransferase family 4 protein n=1 Tax=Modestobacter sp. VKM Ac-2986 TaxID=3004140 RepID=UPI0022AB8188|nr:glycosyltransferase family 4 protein [Modestobacter sp. VKM Ac-2986]MCZ2830221.1 glycosyltransferase family 4 protein [Modestobacter sp. VKM Ac-2986]
MRRTVLVAHPSADLYGSDLQLVESVSGLTAAGWEVVVALPGEGPLRARLEAAGATVELLPVPVLRKSLLRPAGLLGLVVDTSRALPVMVRRLRALDPAVVYVNTVTVPLWLVAARLAGRPALCHVHEAEDDAPRLVGVLLNAPLLLARTVVVNSNAAAATLLRAVPALRRRTEVVHNGVAGPPEPLPPLAAPTGPRRVVLVGRLAPRKGTDVALEAAALLRAQGRDVVLQLCGTVFPGYEWFEQQLRDRAARPDLAGAVEFAGYTSPTWPALAQADVVLVPSRAEPFGNTAVEAQLAGRPVVVSAVQGLREIVTDGETGLLVTPGDPADLARAVGTVLDDAGLAGSLATAGRGSALRRFSRQRYQDTVTAVVERTAR